MPIKSNKAGKGMFPYYTCTMLCHDKTSGQKIDEAASSWLNSSHAQSLHMSGDNNVACAKCKSPPNYNASIPAKWSPGVIIDQKNVTIAASDWQGIQCRVCHNMHDRKMSSSIGGSPLGYYNSTSSSLAGKPVYEAVHNATELCEKCHTGSSHDSKFGGTHKNVVGFDCASCHLNTTFNKNETHLFTVKNTTSGVEGCDVCHKAADHTFKFTSLHENKVTCEACHDKTVARNATGYATSSDGKSYGLYLDTATGLVSSWKDSHGTPATWPLHNISKPVSCDKCHGTKSKSTGLELAPDLAAMACAVCHTSYGDAVNSSKHFLNASTKACTGCHVGYVSSYGHTTGIKGFIVNRTTCINCHIEGVNGFNFSHKNTTSPDCTQCHFANNSARFGFNSSLYAHDHNLTVEHNYYYYNKSGTIQMPLKRNGGIGEGMFPAWTCTQWCHGSGTSTSTSIDNASITWVNSKHAQSLEAPGSDNNVYCARCKSPPNYNASIPAKWSPGVIDQKNVTIAASDWQGIQCRICHDIHYPKYSNSMGGFPLAFYNATASSPLGYSVYDQVHNATELCEKCHSGNNGRNFGGTHKDTVGFDCASCHLNTTSVSKGGFNNKSHSFEVMNVYTGVKGCEVCHKAADHTFEFTSDHTGKVTCEACHDKTVTMNATGYAFVNFGTSKKAGLYVDPANGEISSWMGSSVASAATWSLHNISKDVSCNKCHGTKSAVTNSLLAPTFGTMGCVKCHPSYASVVNSSKHSLNASTKACTGCHKGYDTLHNGYTGLIVNESNSCRTCHKDGYNGFYEEHTGNASKPADCTQCHFANTTKSFSLNASLYTHDHNLTVEHNFYEYNISGMPIRTNGGTGIGMFPYYTCTLTCHKYNATTGREGKIERVAPSWLQSAHARSLHMSGDNNVGCAKCKSPTNYNASIPAKDQKNVTIAASDWQGIQCRVCHNMHNKSYSKPSGGDPLAYYNATASSLAGYSVYEQVHNATELCEKCHTGGSHDSKYGGTHKDTLGFDCASCHANSTFNNATHLFEVKNTTSGVTGCEVCHNSADHTWQFTSLHETIITCEACHDKTVARNSSDFVVNVSVGMDAGLYKDTSTNKWTTYKVSHGTPASWPLHNISKSIDCNKCHGAKSVYSGAIASNLTAGGITYFTTDTMVVGYNFIVPWLYLEPTIYANYLINSSLSGVTGVNKTLNWNSTSQKWEGYEYLNGVYLGTNFKVVGKKPYFVNSLSAGKTYTFKGTK
jgi:hypothetical protein